MDEATGNGAPRSRESVLFEIDYAQAALADILALNDHLRDAANGPVDAQLAVLELVLGADRALVVEKVNAACRSTLDAIAAAQRPLDSLIELYQGRALALRHEAGLDETAGS